MESSIDDGNELDTEAATLRLVPHGCRLKLGFRFAIREAFASSPELAQNTRTDFAPLRGGSALVTSGFHATIELREPCRLPVAVGWPVYAGNELRRESSNRSSSGERAGCFQKLLCRVSHRRDCGMREIMMWSRPEPPRVPYFPALSPDNLTPRVSGAPPNLQ